MQHADRLADERRARLAAELMLEQVQSELSTANQKIAAHNRALSDEIVHKREEVEQVRTEAETLRDENQTVRHDLEQAESAIMIAERRLWDSLETIHDGFAVFDPDRIMVAANRAYLAAFDGLEMIGPGIHYHDLLRLMCEEGIVDLESVRPEDWIAMMCGRWDEDRIETVTVKLWNGAFVKVIDRRTRDGDMVSLGLNITSTIKREAELEEARAKAEAANRAKSAFLANMSHEIRTPMNGVIGMADMLGETVLDEEQRLFVETIRNSGEALLVIINDVLDYSKIEAKKLELHPAEFDLERCIHEVLMLLQPLAHDKGLQLAVDYDMFMPTQFIGDPGRVRQILTNLAGNAVKFTQEGHVAIRVVGLPVDGSTAYRIHVTVEDTGIGIPKEKLKTIFGEFSQVEDERNRRYDGTGLGLAITQRLVRLMGGEIWVDSEENVGSGFGFHVTMPVAPGASTVPIIAPEWIERAIVVDEPQMMRSILTKQISAMGLEALSVRLGSEFDALTLSPRDVIVLGEVAMAEPISPVLLSPGAPQAVALLSSPMSGALPAGVAAVIQKPAQRRDIARVLDGLTPPEPVAAPNLQPPQTVEQVGLAAPSAIPAAAPSDVAVAAPVAVAPSAGVAPVPPIPTAEPAVQEVPAAIPESAAEPNAQEPVVPSFAAPPAEAAPMSVVVPELAAAPPPAEMATQSDATTPPAPNPPAVAPVDPAAALAAPLPTPEMPGAVPPSPVAQEPPGHALPPAASLPGEAAPVPPPLPVAPDQPNTVAEAPGTPDTPPAAAPQPLTLTQSMEVPAEALPPAPPGPAAPLASAPTPAAPLPPQSVSAPMAAQTPAMAPAPNVAEPAQMPPASAPKAPIAPAVPPPTPPLDASTPLLGVEPAPAPSPPIAPAPTPVAQAPMTTAPAPAAQTMPLEAAPAPPAAPAEMVPAQPLAAPPAEAGLAGPAEPAASSIAQARQMRVLTAEDNKTNRLVFSKMVQTLDIDLSFAENGLEAVAAFEANPPDLIFTDISMPEMDGKEASRRIRQIEAQRGLARTPIIAITAHAMAGDADEILAAGVDTYLTKPLKRAALVEAIERAMPSDVRPPVGAVSTPVETPLAAPPVSAPAVAPATPAPSAPPSAPFSPHEAIVAAPMAAPSPAEGASIGEFVAE
ncbi:MAG: ATP-binding protein [Pseudomonadota bacterium]